MLSNPVQQPPCTAAPATGRCRRHQRCFATTAAILLLTWGRGPDPPNLGRRSWDSLQQLVLSVALHLPTVYGLLGCRGCLAWRRGSDSTTSFHASLVSEPLTRSCRPDPEDFCKRLRHPPQQLVPLVRQNPHAVHLRHQPHRRRDHQLHRVAQRAHHEQRVLALQAETHSRCTGDRTRVHMSAQAGLAARPPAPQLRLARLAAVRLVQWVRRRRRVGAGAGRAIKLRAGAPVTRTTSLSCRSVDQEARRQQRVLVQPVGHRRPF